MASSRKKVVVRRFSPGPVWGYLPTSRLVELGPPAMLDLLDLAGRVQPMPLTDVKYVSYVRDFNTADQVNPERLLRKTFLARPRTEGLWLRLQMRDGDRIEGLAGLDLGLADGWSDDLGVHLVPADIRGNTQRLYVPRSAVTAMEVLGVITTPSRRRPQNAQPNDKQPNDEQPDLFALEVPPGARTH